MARRFVLGLALALIVFAASRAAGGETIQHELFVVLDPGARHIAVEDVVTLPDRLVSDEPGSVHFALHAGLVPASVTTGVEVSLTSVSPRAELFGPGPGASPPSAGVPVEVYRMALPAGVRTFKLAYAGEIYHPLSQEESYARGFRQTPGTVSDEGAYLSGGTLWYPWFGGDFVTFTLTMQLPGEWDAVSQGGRTGHERGAQGTRVRWESTAPQDEIYLIAGPFTEYGRVAGPVEILVFLRTADEALAGKYLEVGAQYLRMYADLIGPYPYPKFALVENFWETGYGMPSFSLLGPRVIRFPFILHSSYPHEILHNWWGNGVYVDWARGNWCEGLTAYLADHLIQEGRGTGDEYRQTTLQKYVDYVSRGRDFPLVEFTSRHSSATEAVGYGKSLMFYHMLRTGLGDDVFVDGLRRFYRDNEFRAATFDDIRQSLEAASGRDLGHEFAQWLRRAGAPRLSVEGATARRKGKGWVLEARILQTQPGEIYRLRLPVAVTLEGVEQAQQTVTEMDDRHLDLEIRLAARPLRLDVDPEFDVFRRLDPSEIPPALSGVFGAERVLVILPARAPPPLLEAYRALAESWARSQPGEWTVSEDDRIEALPQDQAVWLFGWENRHLDQLGTALAAYDAQISALGARMGKTDISPSGHSVVIAARHPGNPALTLAWLAADASNPLPGLGRKLPHYHKYSYLGFEGDEPSNVTKGRWPAVGSPLTIFVPEPRGAVEAAPTVERAALSPRRPLAELPPVFSGERMNDTVRRLADPSLEGRGFGSPGLTAAGEWIAGVFKELGLHPAGDEGTYFQSWKARGGDPEREAVLRNVVGVIPGSRPDWEGQSVVIGAHYDHLGRGWPESHEEDRGKIHPGADDNASGVALLLELARVLGGSWAPDRSVVFVAFAGEEADRLGSRHYVQNKTDYPARKAIGMVNLDTVGRLGKGKLLVLGTGTAQEWVHIFRGASFVTGVPVEPVTQDVGGSDQVSFIEAGVPAVQLFSGPHLDYHRPGDTADKVDVDGLVQVASVVKETVEYLAERPEPLTTELGPGEQRPRGEGRKVSLGTIPDFTYSGPGVRLEGVAPDSPAERAGLRPGDVVTRLPGGESVTDLKDFSNILKTLSAGQEVPVHFVREGVERETGATLERR